MAFTVTARHSGNSTTSAVATLATDSQTPAASSLFITAAGGERNSQVQAYSWQTPTGGGYTYTNLQVPNTSFDWVADSTFAVGGAVWRADVGGSPAAHTVTVDPHSTADTCFLGAVCFDITGHSSSTPVQSKAGGASVNPSSDTAAGTITLDSAPTSGNLIVVCWMVGGDVTGGVTSPTSNGQSFTSITNQTSANCHVSAFYRVATGAENATISTTDLGQSVGAYAVIAFEIAGGAAPSPSVALQLWSSQLFGPWPRAQMQVLGSDTVDSGSYSGTGSLTVTAATVADGRAEGTASLSETAAITASGRAEGTASLTETAAITASGEARGAASLSVTDTITASGRAEGTASLTATATISATGGLEGQYSGTASLTETATITASGQAQGSGSLNETATISSSGRAEGSASLTATATITATGQLQGSSSATLTVTDTITASGETRGTASLTETATITPTGAAQGTATRSTTATITSSGRAEGAASLVESANITAAGNMSAAGQASLVVGAGFFAVGGIPTGATIMSRVSTGSDGLRAGTGRGLSRVSTGSPLSRP